MVHIILPSDSSFFSLLLRKSIINSEVILKTSMDKNEKSFHEIAIQCEYSSDIQNESKDTQTYSIYSSISTNKYTFVNPYSILNRVNQGEKFLKFLSKQNFHLDLIYTNFLKHLQKYIDNFLYSLQKEHSLYGIYRQDMIRYVIILQEYINELRTKLNILQEANKNFLLFQKHYHKISQNKSQLEDLLNKYEKYSKEIFYQKKSIKYQQEFFNIYQKSSIQLRTIEQQRLLAIREQMRFIIHLTLDKQNLFISNNFDDLLNKWENDNLISIDHWSHFRHHSIKSQHDMSLILLDEIKQILDEYSNHSNTKLHRLSNQFRRIDNSNEEFIKRIDSITSNITHSHI